MKKFIQTFLLAFILLSVTFANAQTKNKFSYASQQKYIPADLGKVYLGMPFEEFVKQIDLNKAEVGDSRFEWLSLTVPFDKGSINEFTVKIQGLTQEDKAKILRRETVKKKDENGFEYETEIEKLQLDKTIAKGFIYAIYIDFKSGFDLKKYAIKTYGKDGEVRKADDKLHLFDIQWTKKTSDNLTWLIRSFHEGEDRNLQLLGRIDGTEWELEEL